VAVAHVAEAPAACTERHDLAGRSHTAAPAPSTRASGAADAQSASLELKRRRQSHSGASSSSSTAQAAGASTTTPRATQRPRAGRPPFREFVLTEKVPLVRGATGVAKQLSAKGGRLYINTCGHKQLHHCLEALSTARQLLLARSDTGIAIQPAIVSEPEAGAAAAGAAAAAASSSRGAALAQQAARLHLYTADESALRRPETRPLLCARRTSSDKLAGAIVARLAAQGFTRTLSLGPIASSVALEAVAKARGMLRRAGQDCVVLPGSLVVLDDQQPSGAIEYVDYSELVSWEEDEQEPGTRLLDLRVVRCTPGKPWKLQPFPVPPKRQQQQEQQEAGELEAAAAAAAAACAYAEAEQQQQQQQAPRRQRQAQAASPQPGAADAGPCSSEGCCRDVTVPAAVVPSTASTGSASNLPGATRTVSSSRKNRAAGVGGSSNDAVPWRKQQQRQQPGTVLPERQAGSSWRQPVLASAVQPGPAGVADAAQ
jgi:stage V sporulation protein SpoVS